MFLYLAANLALTFHNNWIMKSLGWKNPWLMTAIHITTSGVGAKLVSAFIKTKIKSEKINLQIIIKAILFSALTTLNIALSNISMLKVSLSFHQMIRSSAPVFTVMLQWIFQDKHPTLKIMPSLILVIIGVYMATLSEAKSHVKDSIYGITLAISGVMLAALKGVASNIFLVGPLKMSPLRLLWLLTAPCLLQCLAFAWYSNELSSLEWAHDTSLVSHLVINGILAFMLNYISLSTNARLGPLTVAILANCKQVIIVGMALFVYENNPGIIQVFGIVLTLIGGFWYTNIQHRSSKNLLPVSQNE